MKKIKLLLITISFVTTQGFSQVRPAIEDFSEEEQIMLVNAMMEYIDVDIIERHCVHHMITGGMIHGDFDFLPFHRTYLEGMEDYILSKGEEYKIFVPLPKWNPANCTPDVFQVVDPDCVLAMCDMDDSATCGNPNKWCPNIPLPYYLSLPVQAGNNNDLCDWYMNPTFPTDQDCCPSGLSRIIEGQSIPTDNPVNSRYHNSVHQAMGHPDNFFGFGVMLGFRSPAAPIFWLWHAYVDDIWKTWECNCSQSGMGGTFDLYMKDTYDEIKSERDRGEEPNIDNGPMWESEDIWIRTSDDGFETYEHQNPVYQGQNTDNYVYVRVRNRGCVTSSGTEQLTLYWSKAGTNLSYPSHWISPANGGYQTSNNKPLGGVIETKTIPAIPAGASTVIEFVWQPVNPEDYVNLYNDTDPLFWISEPQPHHFCLLASIEGTADPITFTDGSSLNTYVKENNNVVWKNVSVIEVEPKLAETGEWLDDLTIGAAVFIGDTKGTGGIYDLEFSNPERYNGNPVTAEAEVSITLSNLAWHKWENGGFQSENIEIVREEINKVIVTGSPAKLKNLAFSPKEFTLMSIGFNFLSRQVTGQTDFSYLAIQRNNTDNSVVGGETYKIKIPGREGFYANAGDDRLVSQYTSVDLEAEDIGEPAIYNWYDTNGNLIYTGKEFTVSAEITEKYKLEVIATDGLKDYDEVEVKVKLYELFAMYPNPASDNVTITYNASSAGSAYLILQQPYSSVQNQYLINTSLNETSINVSTLPTGVYSVILVCDGTTVDIKSLVVH